MTWGVARVLTVAWELSWSDLRSRYKRTFFGPSWLVLNTLVGVVGLGLVWSTLRNIPFVEFVPILTVGLVLWQLISACLVESSDVFYKNGQLIKNLNIPLLVFPVALLFKQIQYLAHNLLVVALVLATLGTPITVELLYVVPALMTVFANILWVSILIGIVATRYRDVQSIIGSLMPILFFLSPVLYTNKDLGGYSFLYNLNPMSFMMNIVRDPIMGAPPNPEDWYYSLIFLLIGIVITSWAYSKAKSRIVFWI